MPVFTHRVPDDPPHIRLDAYAMSIFALLPSRSQARKSIRAGRLTVNGAPCRSAWFVRGGDALKLQPAPASRVPVLALDLPVVYQDPWLAVIAKPAGIHVRGNRARTVHRALRHNLEISDLPDALPDPDPVHRLDYRTGGLLLVARTAMARVALGRAFEDRRVHKRYRAIIVGRLEGEGEVSVPIDGRPAETGWRVLGHSRSLHTEWLTIVDLFPVTGRQHQLRRHMAHLGTPILGDDLYTEGRVLRGHGLYLCAAEQRFDHPANGSEVHVQIDPPPKFASFLAREQRRWDRTER